MKRITVLIASALALLAAGSRLEAAPIVIDFETGNAISDGLGNWISYTEDGLTFSKLPHLHWSSFDMQNHVGDPTGSSFLITFASGAFSLLSLDVVVGTGTITTFITNTGATAAVPVPPQFPATFSFPASFQNVLSVTWDAGQPDPDNGAMTIDNVTFTSETIPEVIPEPGTWALLGVGVAWLAHGRRKRTNGSRPPA